MKNALIPAEEERDSREFAKAFYPKGFVAVNGDIVSTTMTVKQYRRGKIVKTSASIIVNKVTNIRGFDSTAQRLQGKV